MLPPLSPAAVVPAAGASRRMGRPKLVLPWGDATVVEATTAALLRGGVARVVVVRAPESALAGWRPPAGVEVAVNPRPDAGMLSTVRSGLAALVAAGIAPDPLLVCPADLPALRPETVAALLAAYAEAPRVVVPTHRGRRGHPLVVPPRWLDVVAHGDLPRGLRDLLERAGAEVAHVEVDDPGSVADVDTPEDYATLRPQATETR